MPQIGEITQCIVNKEQRERKTKNLKVHTQILFLKLDNKHQHFFWIYVSRHQHYVLILDSEPYQSYVWILNREHLYEEQLLVYQTR